MNRHTIYMRDMWKYINDYSQEVIMTKHHENYWITNKYIIFKCLPEHLKYELDEATEQQRLTIISLLNVNKNELFKCELLSVLLTGNLHEGYSSQYIRVLKSDVEVTYVDEKYIALFDQLEVSFYIKKAKLPWSTVYVYSRKELIAVIMPIRMSGGELEPLRKFVEVIGAELTPENSSPYMTSMQRKHEQQMKFNKYRAMMLKRKGILVIDMSINDDDLPF